MKMCSCISVRPSSAAGTGPRTVSTVLKRALAWSPFPPADRYHTASPRPAGRRSRRLRIRSPTIREESMAYTAVDVAELEGEGPGGAVRKVRRALGARAFGFNHITLPAGAEGHEHDHAEDGQEEVYVVVR